MALMASLAAAQDTAVLQLPGPRPMAFPPWLAPFPQARGRSAASSPKEATSSYVALSPAAAVVAHYEGQLRAANMPFRTTPDEAGASIEVPGEKASALVRIHQEEGGARVDVRYAVNPDPPSSPAEEERILAPLVLEWPAWLEVPGGRLVSQRTNPPGRYGKGLEDTCPGDVLGRPSQGCLKRVYESSGTLKDLYEHFDNLLEGHGYATRGASRETNAYPDLGKYIAPPFASLTMRHYPAPPEGTYYHQLNIFLRQPQTPGTKVEIAFLVRNPPGVETPTGARSLTGVWEFTHVAGRFSGTVALRQSGSSLTGTWHTAAGKVEPDTPVVGEIKGATIYLTRTIGNLRQDYVLTVSPDRDRIDGYGDGWGIQHGNLDLRRAVAAPQ
jgi:hypothetical protein